MKADDLKSYYKKKINFSWLFFQLFKLSRFVRPILASRALPPKLIGLFWPKFSEGSFKLKLFFASGYCNADCGWNESMPSERYSIVFCYFVYMEFSVTLTRFSWTPPSIPLPPKVPAAITFPAFSCWFFWSLFNKLAVKSDYGVSYWSYCISLTYLYSSYPSPGLCLKGLFPIWTAIMWSLTIIWAPTILPGTWLSTATRKSDL